MMSYAPGTIAFASTGLALVTVLLSACEPGIPTHDPSAVESLTPVSESIVASSCEEEAPLCVVGCGGQAAAVAPSCMAGDWVCNEGLDVNLCPLYKGTCTLKKPCGTGYNCVHTMHYPAPSDEGVCQRGVLVRDSRLENCAEWGTLMPGESAAILPAMVGSVVKFAAQLGVTVNCSQDGCYALDQCCGSCVGEYAAELAVPKSDAQPLLVRIVSEGIPCVGGPCDLSCSPLTVGETYRMWGVLTECTGTHSCRFVMMGACPL